MEEKVADFLHYKKKQGNPNVGFFSKNDEKMITEIKSILEKNKISLEDSTYNLENYWLNNEVSAAKETTGGDHLADNGYVNEKELKALEDRLEQKINHNQEIFIQKLDSTKNEINLKFDNQLLEFKDLLNTKFNEQKDKQSTNNKWLITTVIATAGLLFTAIKLFV